MALSLEKLMDHEAKDIISPLPEHDLLRLLVHARLFEILELGLGVVLPQLLQLIDLLRRDLASTQLLLFRGNLDEPGQELPVLDQRRPLRWIPGKT